MTDTIFVCFGRLQEELAKMPQERKARTTYRSGGDVFSSYAIKTFKSRAFVARMIRQQERGPSSHWHWRAAVPLRETEGY